LVHQAMLADVGCSVIQSQIVTSEASKWCYVAVPTLAVPNANVP
jgi:hypothetical protein